MRPGPPLLPLAGPTETVRYVVIDDEPRYRSELRTPAGLDLAWAGGYGTVDAFIGLQREPVHVVVLDLCLNRATGDTAVLQGVRAIQRLAGEYGHRVLVYTADERPEPVARCVAAGAAGYISKYADDDSLARAIDEIGRTGWITTAALHDALRRLVARCRDIRPSEALEETLVLLDRGLTDREIAERRNLSRRTIEDHKRKILELFGADMEARALGYAGLARELGVGPADLVNDPAGHRPSRGAIARGMPWLRRRDAR
jgi:DNA-binding NarL/FixJ family response regulator